MIYKVEGYSKSQNIGNESSLYGRDVEAVSAANAVYVFLSSMKAMYPRSYGDIAEAHAEGGEGLCIAYRINSNQWELHHYDAVGDDLSFHVFKL